MENLSSSNANSDHMPRPIIVKQNDLTFHFSKVHSNKIITDPSSPAEG